MQGDELLLRLPDAQRVSTLSRSTLYSLIKSGRLESVTVGRTRLIPRASLERFVEELRNEQRLRAEQPPAA